jgi:hypothetical protein
MSQYDIAIAYRIYPKVASPALGLPYSDDKLHFAEICVRSLKLSLGKLRAKVWVLLDGCPDSYADMFRRYFDEKDLTLIALPAIGNQATFGKQIDILLQQNDSEFVYFAEDDYVYLPNQFTLMLDFLRAYDDVDFISPYDHLDCYTREIHNHPKWIRVHSNHHWRTAASTCLTFLTSKPTLRAEAGIFRTYCRRNFDCSLWLSLTKKSLYSPVKFLQIAHRESHFAKIIVKAWIHGWSRILLGKRRRLWVPIPSIATHLDKAALAPSIDWASGIRQLADDVDVDLLSASESPRTYTNAILKS